MLEMPDVEEPTIEKKKARIIQLAAQESPKLSRRQIADLVPCSTGYVANILGASRPYKRRAKDAP